MSGRYPASVPQWLGRLARRVGPAVLVAVTAAAVVGAWSSSTTPRYRAETHVLLPQADEAILVGQVRLVAASSELAKTTAESVPGVSAEDVLAAVTVTRQGSAITIAATGSNPVVVRDIADGHVQSYLALSGPGVLEGAEIISPATAPTEPVSPRPVRDGGVAAAIGLVVGGLGGVMWDRRRDRITTGADIRGEFPVLAEVPVDPEIDERRPNLPAADRPDAAYAEAIRSLVASLDLQVEPQRARRILVTSTVPGEGKSLIAANLAWVAASQGLRTVLVGGDGRRPQVRELLAPYVLDVPAHQRRRRAFDGLVAASGAEGPDRLVTAVAGDHLIMNMSPTKSSDLFVVPTLPGASDPDPGPMLGSGVVGSVLAHLDVFADVVVVDAPTAARGADDAHLLADHMDDVILVAAAGSASRHQLARCARSLNRRGRQVCGVVVNRVVCRSHRTPRSADGTGTRRPPEGGEDRTVEDVSTPRGYVPARSETSLDVAP